MALYHFHVAQIGRAKGLSAVAASAYRSGEELYDDYYGETHDYTRKNGVLYTEIMIPDYAPDRFRDRAVLWNEVEKVEKHPKAQLCYSFDIALQNEFTFEENLSLVRKFVSEEMVSKGMICDVAVHEPDKEGGIQNPHFHIICPIRPYTEEDEWGEKQHREYLIDENGERIRDQKGRYIFNAVPTTDWGRPETLDRWREHWADMVNEKFEEKNLPCRIDHRSYEDRGIDLIPQVHEGSAVRKMEARGIVTEKRDHNRFINVTNRMIRDIVRKIKDLAEWFMSVKTDLDQMKGKSLDGLILEYFNYRDKVAETYSHGVQKAKMSNFKLEAKVISYLHGNNLETIPDLEERISHLNHTADVASVRIGQLKDSISLYNEHIRNCKALMETRDIYEQSQSIFFPGAKKKFQSEHQKELKRYHAAERYFSRHRISGDPENFLDGWQKSLAEDKASLENEYASIKPINAELRQLKEIKNAIDYALAKRKGENPDMPSLRMHDQDQNAFQQALRRKSFKDEYQKAKSVQKEREQSHSQTNTDRIQQKNRHLNLERDR